MIRKLFSNNNARNRGKIKWRSHEPKRIEAFSDGVFAFAVSLLVFSLEVPKNSEELLNGMKAFFPFAFCFGVIFMIWFAQYKFFRHYGMDDSVTICLNAALLVIVLGLMYPLKFMVSGWLLNGSGSVFRPQDVLPIVIIYKGAFTIIYSLFTLMHVNAYNKRAELKLTDIEVFETRTYLYINLGLACIGLVVIVVAIIFSIIIPHMVYLAFAFYWLIGPVFGIMDKRRRKLFHEKFGNIPIEEHELGAE